MNRIINNKTAVFPVILVGLAVTVCAFVLTAESGSAAVILARLTQRRAVVGWLRSVACCSDQDGCRCVGWRVSAGGHPNTDRGHADRPADRPAPKSGCTRTRSAQTEPIFF